MLGEFADWVMKVYGILILGRNFFFDFSSGDGHVQEFCYREKEKKKG